MYATDALASDRVKLLLELPDASHPPIVYPVAILADSQHPEAADFLAFLSSAEARRIFLKHGFGRVHGRSE